MIITSERGGPKFLNTTVR